MPMNGSLAPVHTLENARRLCRTNARKIMVAVSIAWTQYPCLRPWCGVVGKQPHYTKAQALTFKPKTPSHRRFSGGDQREVSDFSEGLHGIRPGLAWPTPGSS